MRQNASYEERLTSKIDPGNQAIFVSANIEHHKRIHVVGTSEDLFKFSKAFPLPSTRHPVPTIKPTRRIRPVDLVLTDGLVADHVHRPACSHNGNNLSKEGL